MEFEQEEQQIVELLSKLKDRGGTYPKKLLASRRQVFLSQIASVGVGLGVGEGIKTAAKTSRSGTIFHLPAIPTSSFVEMILVVAIVVQASVIAYTYRQKLAEFLSTFSTSSPSIPTDSYIPVTGASPTEMIASDTSTPVATETPTFTPSSTVTQPSTSVNGDSNTGNTNPDTGNDTSPGVTPRPTKDNNGNHYGQTPKPPKEKNNPKSTKASGNENGGGDKKKKP